MYMYCTHTVHVTYMYVYTYIYYKSKSIIIIIYFFWCYCLLTCRLEEESNAAQKLAQERAAAENKIKGLEEQMSVQEDGISKVCVCLRVHIHVLF